MTMMIDNDDSYREDTSWHVVVLICVRSASLPTTVRHHGASYKILVEAGRLAVVRGLPLTTMTSNNEDQATRRHH